MVSKSVEGEWIEWRGGECPVASTTIVEYRFNDGEVARDCAGRLRWHHEDPFSDIAAYRLATLPSTGGEG